MEEPFELDFLTIHEVNRLDYRLLSEKVSRNKDLNDRINAKRAGRTFGWSRKLLDSYPGNLIWGEGGWLYIRNVLRKARQLVREEGISHVYSSFRPLADHYIAYRLKKEFPQLIWIADFRDLPVDRNRENVFFPGWQDRRYRDIFEKADFLITVSEGLRKRLLDYHDHVLVVRNGMRRLFLPDNPTLPDAFTITYTGSLYPKLQDPSAFFASLRELISSGQLPENEVRLVYAGKDHRIWNGYLREYGLEAISVVRGKVSLTESIRLQHESHVNLLLTWSGPHSGGVLTGKLSEYLAAGRPVLCLVNGGRDEELEEIARENPFFRIFIPGADEKLNETILEWHRSMDQDDTLNNIPVFEESAYRSGWEARVASILDRI